MKFLQVAATRLGWSARSTHRALKVARTIADLAGAQHTELAHVAEAMQYLSKGTIQENYDRNLKEFGYDDPMSQRLAAVFPEVAEVADVPETEEAPSPQQPAPKPTKHDPIPPEVESAIVSKNTTEAENKIQKLRSWGGSEPRTSSMIGLYEKAKALAESKGWDWNAIEEEVRKKRVFVKRDPQDLAVEAAAAEAAAADGKRAETGWAAPAAVKHQHLAPDPDEALG